MPEIVLPNGWRPRPYQRKLWSYLENGGKRACAVWHRRAGKDDVCLHWTAVAAMQRPAVYWHMLPQASQARKAVWDAVNPHTGKRRIDEAFPPELREATRENEMFIRFKNGSSWQVIGSDNYNSLVGAPPAGIIFSEWSLADPQAWAYLRPILAENGGWAFFIYTPRGRNHGYTTYQNALNDPEWYAEKLSVRDTGILSEEKIAKERADYVDDYGEDDGDARFRQEWLCDFSAAISGAYYGREMAAAEEEGRITAVPWEPKLPVHVAWDLGYSDSTCLVFAQRFPSGQWRIIDFVRNNGVGLDWYARELDKRPYKYGEIILPHDAANGDVATGKTRLEVLEELGLKRLRVLPNAPGSVPDGIQASRQLLRQSWLDETKCKFLIEALRQYRREWDDSRKVFRDRPLHDWCSDPADAFRYLAMGDPENETEWKPIVYSDKGIV